MQSVNNYTKASYEPPSEILDLAQKLEILGREGDIQYFENPNHPSIELRFCGLNEANILKLLGISSSGDHQHSGLNFSREYSIQTGISSAVFFAGTTPIPDAIPTILQPSQESRGVISFSYQNLESKIDILINRTIDLFSVDLLPSPQITKDFFCLWCQAVANNL